MPEIGEKTRRWIFLRGIWELGIGNFTLKKENDTTEWKIEKGACLSGEENEMVDSFKIRLKLKLIIYNQFNNHIGTV